MLDTTVIQKLKERYPNIHPLIFHRSVERAKTNGNLFDILDTFPNVYPIEWDEDSRCWRPTDVLQIGKSDFREEKSCSE